MSLRGVRQLRKLIIRYSDYDGSSKGIREWLRLNVVEFAQNNPEMMIEAQIKRNVHPYLQGQYKSGNMKTICVKNLRPERIQEYAMFLRNQIGRRVSISKLEFT
jgi:large subunit ribosomal protein L43